MKGQLMVIGKMVGGPKVPTLKETEASLSYVQCFLNLACSLINVSIFHSALLDTFWIALQGLDIWTDFGAFCSGVTCKYQYEWT